MGYSARDMNSVFARVYMGIRFRGVPVVLDDGEHDGMRLKLKSCYAYDAMLALKKADGSRELGVLRDGVIMTGMFPRMSREYALEDVSPDRVEYYSRNLEFYQARLKL